MNGRLLPLLLLIPVLLAVAACTGSAPVAGVQASMKPVTQQTLLPASVETSADTSSAPAVQPTSVPASSETVQVDSAPAASLATATADSKAPQPIDVLRVGDVISTTVVYSGAGSSAEIGTIRAGKSVVVTRRQGDRYEFVYNQNGIVHAWLPAASVSYEDPATPTLQPADGATTVATTTTPDGSAKATAAPGTEPVTTAAGKIVFQTSNGGAIYIMAADGSGLRLLTTGFEPNLSPDGNQVAFTRWAGAPGLYVINVDGSGERLLIGADRPRSPAWTPDGQSIVFERTVETKTCRLTPFGCLTDDELRERLGGPCSTDPRGRSMCIDDFPVTSRNYTNLTRIDLLTGALHDLPAADSATAPSTHPDQDGVVFEDDNGLAITHAANDGTPQRLVQLPGLVAAAVFSPGGQFVYAARKSGDHWDIWRWTVDGGGATALTSPPLLRDRAVNNVSPTLSPDGKSIVFLSDRSGQWALWIMDADGGSQRLLVPDTLAGIEFRYDGNNERMVDWG